MSVLVFAEYDARGLTTATLRTLTAASQLSDTCHVLVVGHALTDLIERIQSLPGVNQVIVVDHPLCADPSDEQIAQALMWHAEGHSHIVAAATTLGQRVIPRLAGMMDLTQYSNVLQLHNNGYLSRPTHAGSVIETVQPLDAPVLMTIRSAAFQSVVAGSDRSLVTVINSDFIPQEGLTTCVGRDTSSSDGAALDSARVVIAGGRGLGSVEAFDRLAAIAKRMGAALGATRAAVDAGYAPNACQVGQTGQTVAPELYIAVGVSGAVQHIAGMKESATIVAINKDPDAEIFKVADYCLVADIHALFPLWEAALKGEEK